MASFSCVSSSICLYIICVLVDIIHGIDCSQYPTQVRCNSDSNGGCSWVNDTCRCASSTDNAYFFILDHTRNISLSETDSLLSWLTKIINTGMTANSAMGLTVQQAPYPNVEAIAVRTWSEQIALLNSTISGAGSGSFNQFTYAMQDTPFRYSAFTGSVSNKYRILMATDYPCGIWNTNTGRSRLSFECTPPYNTAACQLRCDANDTTICSQADEFPTIAIYSNSVNDYDYGCITSNASTDFFYLNDAENDAFGSLDNITPTILDRMCPLDTYTVTVTEVKVDTSSLRGSETYNAPFVEIYNNNSFAINLRKLRFEGLVTGTFTSPPTPRLAVENYLVIYNADIGNVTCAECTCITSNGIRCDTAVYIPCGTGYSCSFDTSMTNTNWNLVVKDTIESTDTVIADVAYSASSFPSIADGWTVELVGAEWQQSCNQQGSPGSSALFTCTTDGPTAAPTPDTQTPTKTPTNTPTTDAPSETPTATPSNNPTKDPSEAPSSTPSSTPTSVPTDDTGAPSESPTGVPSRDPTESPTVRPSQNPSAPPNYITITPAPTVTAEATVDVTRERTEENDKNFRCKYRDLVLSHYTDNNITVERYAEIMGNAMLSTISISHQASGREDVSSSSVHQLDVCVVYTDTTISAEGTCESSEDFEDQDDDGLDSDEFFAFGTFGLRAEIENMDSYREYIYDLMESSDFLAAFTVSMNLALDEEISTRRRRRSLLATEFEAILLEIGSTDDDNSQLENDEDEFQKTWIWVIILGVILVVVVIFFVFICRWRRSIMKMNEKNLSQHTAAGKNSNQHTHAHTLSAISARTASLPASVDGEVEEVDEEAGGLSSYAQRSERMESHASDDAVMPTMFTMGSTTGVGGDSMYSGHTGMSGDTPMGSNPASQVPGPPAIPPQTQHMTLGQPIPVPPVSPLSDGTMTAGLSIGEDDDDQEEDDEDDEELDDEEVQRNRQNSEELYRTSTELVKLAAAKQNDNNHGPLPVVPQMAATPGYGQPHSTTPMGHGGKVGEQSVDPEMVRRWNSNSSESSSDDNEQLYGRTTKGPPSGD